MRKRNIIIGCLAGLLVLSVGAGLYQRHADAERISELESQLASLREQEKQSAIDRRVSKQLEEIAFGQQTLAEERSQEAIRQSEIAREMTARSETERQKAIEAQASAESSAAEAMNAYQMAEHQRQEADEQRRQAEHAKQVADTMNYVSLGRTLGSQSYAISQAGDTELGNILAYASYYYTSRYGGDLFAPAVFQALTQSAGGRSNWSIHNGSIACTAVSPKDHHLLTVSTYGELYRHTMQGGAKQTTRLLSDRNYCFRDGFAAPNGTDYAISHTGYLVVADGSQLRSVFVGGAKPFSLQGMNDGRQLLIVGENSITLLDVATNTIIGTRVLDFHVGATGSLGGKPLLFDKSGNMHQVGSLDDITTEKIPVWGQVTAFAHSADGRLRAYGMADGTIWLTGGAGTTYKLVGHLSQVTKLQFDGPRLYSSSYDGKLLFWLTNEAQMKPITLFQSNSWLTDFTFSADKNYIWTGQYNGTLTEYLVSMPMIAERLRHNVKRNLTQEEWNYYVGKGIPYAAFAAFGLNNK